MEFVFIIFIFYFIIKVKLINNNDPALYIKMLIKQVKVALHYLGGMHIRKAEQLFFFCHGRLNLIREPVHLIIPVPQSLISKSHRHGLISSAPCS